MSVKWYGDKVLGKIEKGAMTGVVRAVEHVREVAIELILFIPKTGHIYRRRGRDHQASAPGEPFASDTGNALNQIRTIYDPPNFSGKVNFGAAYAPALEFGTRKMEPRPVARPAITMTKDECKQIIKEEIDGVLR